MTCINRNKLNELYDYTLVQDKLNPPKRTNNIIIHYSPILQGCMNTKRVKLNLRTFEFYWIVDVVLYI